MMADFEPAFRTATADIPSIGSARSTEFKGTQGFRVWGFGVSFRVRFWDSSGLLGSSGQGCLGDF